MSILTNDFMPHSFEWYAIKIKINRKLIVIIGHLVRIQTSNWYKIDISIVSTWCWDQFFGENRFNATFFEMNGRMDLFEWPSMNPTYQLKTLYVASVALVSLLASDGYIGPSLVIISNYMISIHKSINACPWTVLSEILPKKKYRQQIMPIQMGRIIWTINL